MGHFGIVFLPGGPRLAHNAGFTAPSQCGETPSRHTRPYHNFLRLLRRQACKEQFDKE
jgi:hypothetical protein